VLRECYDRLFDAAFSDVLCAADIQEEAAPAPAAAAIGGPVAGGGQAQAPAQARRLRHATGTRTVLLRRPRVFTLALVWDSPQVRAGPAPDPAHSRAAPRPTLNSL
jgi:hypothetical protein